MPAASRSGTLYILGTNAARKFPGFLCGSDILPDTSVILIQDAVGLRDLPISNVRVLEEDLQLSHTDSPYPRVSYGGMIEMIFEAERVVVV